MNLETLVRKIPDSVANKVEFFVPRDEWIPGVIGRGILDGATLGYIGWTVRNAIMFHSLTFIDVAQTAIIIGLDIYTLHRRTKRKN